MRLFYCFAFKNQRDQNKNQQWREPNQYGLLPDTDVMRDAETPSQVPDRSPNSRALIVHPLYKDRHPIYQFFGAGRQYEKFQYISIPGFSLPFVVHQNFISSQKNLGSIAWAGGISAAAYISEWLQTTQPKDGGGGRLKLLELGCGTAALVSQCAALCGAQCVMTDLPDVLEWAKLNARSNSAVQWNGHPKYLQALEDSSPGSVSPLLSARTLRWGESSDVESCCYLEEETSSSFDIIVAAECLYVTEDNPDLQAKLLSTLEQLLNKDDGTKKTKLFLSYQVRTGKEKVFVNQTLPSVFPHYVVEEVNQRSSTGTVRDADVYSMVWFRPKSAE
eukprot:scaffold770_cov109-Cylindrotheca_fusiformis.AAC.11